MDHVALLTGRTIERVETANTFDGMGIADVILHFTDGVVARLSADLTWWTDEGEQGDPSITIVNL